LPGITSWVNQDAKMGGTLRAGTFFGPGTTDPNMTSSAGNPTMGFFAPRANRLLRINEPDPGKLEPELATSWEVSGDGKTVIFHIREGVQWHNGDPLSGRDVQATFQRILNPPEGVPSPKRVSIAPVNSVELVGPMSVQFNLDHGYGALFDAVASGPFLIMHKGTLDKNNGQLDGVFDWPGTGPFKYVRNTGLDLVIYERNPNYWNGDLPILDGYEWHKIGRATIPATLLSQRLDLVRLAQSQGQEAAAANSNIIAKSYACGCDYFFHMNKSKKPFDDVRVRVALAMIWDKADAYKATSAVVGKGNIITGMRWVPAFSSWNKILLGDDYVFNSLDDNAAWKDEPTEGWNVDAARVKAAQALMDAAGYSGGLGTIQVDVRGSLAPPATIHAEALEMLINKHLTGTTKFELKLVGRSEAYVRVKNQASDFHASSVAFSLADFDNPVQWLSSWYKTGSDQNYAQYSNPEFDKLMEAMVREGDQAKVAEIVNKAIAMLRRDMPTIPEGLIPSLTPAWWNYVKDSGCETVTMEMSGCHWFDTTWLDK